MKSKQLGLMVICLVTIVLTWQCVDVDETNIPPNQNAQSRVSIVHLVPGVGDATVQVDGQTLGTVSFGDALPAAGYVTLPSGTRNLRILYSTGAVDTVAQAILTDQKGRILVFPDTSGTVRQVEVLHERFTYEQATSSNQALLRFFHGSFDAGPVSIEVDSLSGVADSVLATGVNLGDASPYLSFPPGVYGFRILSDGETVMTFTDTLSAGRRYTQFLFDEQAALKQKLFVDD